MVSILPPPKREIIKIKKIMKLLLKSGKKRLRVQKNILEIDIIESRINEGLGINEKNQFFK